MDEAENSNNNDGKKIATPDTAVSYRASASWLSGSSSSSGVTNKVGSGVTNEASSGAKMAASPLAEVDAVHNLSPSAATNVNTEAEAEVISDTTLPPLGEALKDKARYKTSKAEEFWQINTSNVGTDDPLLGCLLVLTRIEHKPVSAESLVAGLPLVNNKLTPDLFIRASDRAGFSAQLIKRPLREISALVLPAVLLLINKQACLLTAIKQNGMLQIVQPETGEGLRDISVEDLAAHYTGYALFTRPAYQFDSRSHVEGFKSHSQRWFYNIFKKILPYYYEIIVSSLLLNLFAMIAPLFAMNVYDRVVPNNAIETLIVLAIGICTVYCFDFLMKMLRSYFIDTAGKKADILLSATIFEHMIGIKMESRPESVGSFANNLGQFDTFRDFMTSATISSVIDLPFLFMFALLVYYIGGPIVYVTLVTIPVVIISGIIIQGPLNQFVKESYRYNSQKQAMLIESLVGIENIKSSGAEGALQRRWEHLGGMLAKVSGKSKVLSTLAVNISNFSMQLASVAVVIVGVKLITAGELTLGGLIACNMLNSRALQPLSQVASLITRYHQAITSFKSVDSVMKMAVERPQGKTPLHRQDLAGNLEFRDLTFHYPKQDELALDKISFTVSAGEKIGIVGKVGSGKTTLGKLIIGLYTAIDGGVLFDGIDSQQLDLAFLRKKIGYVPQDSVLFYGSVKDNIVIGSPYVDDVAILRAASIAGVTDFVAQHPKGFDLPVGERGEKLSGGQRQSVAIARALLLDPKILVLDEPTNSMDAKSEEIFMRKLQKYYHDKTLILITHKGSMLSLVDRLIMLDKGKIIADGPKDKVIKDLAEGKVKEATARQRKQEAEPS